LFAENELQRRKRPKLRKQCDTKQLVFQGLGRRDVVADFDGGTITTDGGALLLREIDLRNGILDAFAACFDDYRDQRFVDHGIRQMVAQRVYGLCLGYEDINDHEQLRYDPVFATLCDQADVEGKRRLRSEDLGKALAGKSTLNRLETAGDSVSSRNRYKKIIYDEARIQRFFVDHFLTHYTGGKPPRQIILDVDATDDTLHGNQEGRFFHGYYGHYCYLPLYITCDDYLLAAHLRSSNIDACAGTDGELERIITQIREVWPDVQIIVRGDSGFAREWLISWCEEHDVDYLFGLAKNARLKRIIGGEMQQSREEFRTTGTAARVFKDFTYRTRKSWSRERRVVGKAEYLPGGENPRFIVTSLSSDGYPAEYLYTQVYCARGEMENRIKEQQLFLFADRTSSATMRANQLRLWFSAVAYVLMNELRRVALAGTELAQAQCNTMRLRLLKIGAGVTVSVRRVRLQFTAGHPWQELFRTALGQIHGAFP
jgi:hypothetical protein